MLFLLTNLAFAFEPQKEDEPQLDVTPKTDAIINGVDAAIDDYPSTGGMLLSATLNFGPQGSADIRTFVCSSTLIAPDVVMLAAHCLDDTAYTFGIGELENKEIRWSRQADLSEWNGQGSPDWPADSIPATGWVLHPDFTMQGVGLGIAHSKDIALLFLEWPVTEVDHAYLATPAIGESLTEDMTVEVVGWGQSIATGMWEEPPPGSIYIKQQGFSHISEIGVYEFQVGLSESDVRKCHGDSGGPSFIDIDGEKSIIGVTSHAYDESDCFETGGVDTRVDAYLDWIDQEMRLACDDGTRAWCDTPGIVTREYYAELERLAEEEEEGFLKSCASVGAKGTFGWFTCLAFGIFILRRRKMI